MILDRTIEIYSRTETMNPANEGIPSYTYTLAKSTRASVQPINLSSTQLSQWGISDIDANSKIAFFPGQFLDGLGYVVKDLKTSAQYEVRGSNQWPNHVEMLCVPYQGGDPL
jgi:hypothetical protein